MRSSATCWMRCGPSYGSGYSTSGARGSAGQTSSSAPSARPFPVFGRHSRVLRPDGAAVTVRDFLDIVRRESTTVALEQVLHGADLGVIDPVTRQYVTWVWSYSKARLWTRARPSPSAWPPARPIRTSSGPPRSPPRAGRRARRVVRLRTVRQRAMEDDDLGYGSPARPAPLIEQLQHAAWLWAQNRTDRLAAYRGALGETKWTAVHTLGQAVAECLPDGDEDRRIINGLLGSNVMGIAPPEADSPSQRLPGI